MLERFFHLKAAGTNTRTEVLAGVTTFLSMAYILAVNPSILSSAGMDKNAVLIATALAAFVGTMAMAFLANYPFALAPGMGLNAYFAYTICGQMGYSWEVALLAVFFEGLIFIILSFTNVREMIFNGIPMQLKTGISAGIGLFIAFVGLQNGYLVVGSESTLFTIVNFKEDFSTVGICALLTVAGLLITLFLHIKKVRGGILIGVLITWGLGMICQAAGIYTVDEANGFFSLFPVWSSFDPSAIGTTFGACFSADLSMIRLTDFLVIMFALLYMDVFDTLGALIGIGKRAKMLDKKGHLPKARQALLADAIATTAGAVLGTSTTTTYAESATGISEGGRTGLTSVVTAFLFLAAIFLAPVFTAIPGFATAPAMIMVGFLTFATVADIDFHNPLESIPACMCIIGIPVFYSISDGIAFGIISYVILNMVCGRAKKISVLMYILTILFVLKYIFL